MTIQFTDKDGLKWLTSLNFVGNINVWESTHDFFTFYSNYVSILHPLYPYRDMASYLSKIVIFLLLHYCPGDPIIFLVRLVFRKLVTRVRKKGSTIFCLYLCQILTDFQNFFINRHSSEFLARWRLNIPPNVQPYLVKCLCSKMAVVQSWVEKTAMQDSAIRNSYWKIFILWC